MANVVEVIIKGVDKFSGVFKGADKSVQSLARLAKSLVRDFAALGAAAGGFVLGLTKMAQRGAEVLDVQQAFNRLTGDGANALKLLRAQTEGLVSDFDLMVGANKALATGTARTVQEYGELVKIAKAVSGPMGMGEPEAIEAVADAIARVSDRALAQLGIVIDLKQANEEYAATLKKQASELTEVEKREALRQAVFKEGARLTEELDSSMSSAAENADRFATAILNLKDAATQLVASSPSVSNWLEGWTLLLRRMGPETMAGIEAEKRLAGMSDMGPDQLRLRRGDVVREGIAKALELEREERRPVFAGGSPQTVRRLRAELEALNGLLSSIDFQLQTLGAPAPGGGGGAGGGGVGSFSGRGLHVPSLYNRPRFGLAAGGRSVSPFAAGLMGDRVPGGRSLPGLSPVFSQGPIRRATTVPLPEAAEDFSEASQLAVASLGAMAQAAIEGSRLTAQSVIGMITNIVRSLPGVGGLAGSLISAGGGILGALLNRGSRNDPVSVKIADVTDGAARKMAEVRTGPDKVVIQLITPSGALISETERELRRREQRDAISRVPPGGLG